MSDFSIKVERNRVGKYTLIITGVNLDKYLEVLWKVIETHNYSMTWDGDWQVLIINGFDSNEDALGWYDVFIKEIGNG